MKNKLYINSKIEVRKSLVHGYGVFAKKDINKGEVLEECHYVKLINGADKNLYKYVFSWPKHDRKDLKRENIQYLTIPFGYACIYNSSLEDGENNADWETDITNNLYRFKSIKDICADTEILTYYGDAYWIK